MYTKQEWQQKIIKAVTPLPGSIPYTNRRPLNVPGRYEGYDLLNFLSRFNPHLSKQQWAEIVDRGNLQVNGRAVDKSVNVRAGMQLMHIVPDTIEPQVGSNIEIIYEDEHLLVVNKPAPLPVHPCGRFNRNTLVFLLHKAAPDLKLRPAHRLDADTTGVQIFTKNAADAAVVQGQFDRKTVEKIYLAEVKPVPDMQVFSIDQNIEAKPETAGSRSLHKDGLKAETHYPLEQSETSSPTHRFGSFFKYSSLEERI